MNGNTSMTDNFYTVGKKNKVTNFSRDFTVKKEKKRKITDNNRDLPYFNNKI